MTLGHFARRMLRPRLDRPVVVAVERAVVDALGLEEDHRVGVLDRRDQQALGVIGRRGDDDLEARDVGEERFRRLAVRLATENPAAVGRSNDHRHGPFGRGPIADFRDLADDLVVAGVDVIGELDLDDRFEAVSRHPDRRRDDPALADRSVEHAGLAEFLLQAFGDPEDAAEITDVLAEHDDVLVRAHRDLVGVVQRLDHVHRRHQPPPSESAASRCSARCQGTSA